MTNQEARDLELASEKEDKAAYRVTSHAVTFCAAWLESIRIKTRVSYHKYTSIRVLIIRGKLSIQVLQPNTSAHIDRVSSHSRC